MSRGEHEVPLSFAAVFLIMLILCMSGAIVGAIWWNS